MIAKLLMLVMLTFASKGQEFRHCPPVMPGKFPGERPIEITPDPVPPKPPKKG